MDKRLRQRITYFESFEEREEAFRESVSFLIPRRHMGAVLFWKDFGRISREGLHEQKGLPATYITCNPRDCLAFGTARQVLNAAALCVEQSGSDLPAFTRRVGEEFGMGENMDQPIRTLSGGETVKLALAKVYIASARISRVSIASPFSWLSAENAGVFQRLMGRLLEHRIPVNLFALSGEDSKEAIGPGDPFPVNGSKGIGFSLEFKDVKIPLSLTVNPMQSRSAFARVKDFQAEMASPCLVSGNNGQGKSLVARILADAIRYSGTATIARDGKQGTARLLFQDVATQTMLRSFSALCASGPGDERAVLDLYQGIRKAFEGAYGGRAEPGPRIRPADNGEDPPLLEIKAILAAARLAQGPPALILDEPDWGLTREAAVAFVSAVIETAHREGVPILLISHKPWWVSVARSKLLVSRSPKRVEGKRAQAIFSIRLETEGERP